MRQSFQCLKTHRAALCAAYRFTAFSHIYKDTIAKVSLQHTLCSILFLLTSSRAYRCDGRLMALAPADHLTVRHREPALRFIDPVPPRSRDVDEIVQAGDPSIDRTHGEC